MATSNIAAVVASLDRFVKSFDFTRPGRDQSLGRDIVTDIALGIQERSVQEKKGAEAEWPPNSDKPSKWHPQGYRQWKADTYGVHDQPNVRTGQMLSLVSLKGTGTRIQPDAIEMVYGTGTAPTGTATGVPLSKADEKVTDREKAAWAHANTKNPVRPFYEADQPIADRVRETCRENLNDYIRDANAKRGNP